MLSNPLHRFSTYNTLPSSNILSGGHVPSSHMHAGLDPLAHGSQYSFQQLDQQLDVHQNSHVHRSHHVKHRQHPYNGAGPGSNGRPSTNTPATSGPIRRRISRACDQCNQLRTKCDGQSPCAHCVEFGLGCEYIRERKKRGKASRKDLAQQAAAAANGHKSPASRSSEERSPTESRNDNASSTTSLTNDNADFQRPQASRSLSLSTAGLEGNNSARDSLKGRLRASSLESITEISNGLQPHMTSRPEADQIGSPASLSLNSYSSMHGYRPSLNPHMMNGNNHQNFNAGQGSLPGYTDLLDDEHLLESESPTRLRSDTPGNYRLAGTMGGSPCPVCGCPGHEGLELA